MLFAIRVLAGGKRSILSGQLIAFCLQYADAIVEGIDLLREEISFSIFCTKYRL